MKASTHTQPFPTLASSRYSFYLSSAEWGHSSAEGGGGHLTRQPGSSLHRSSVGSIVLRREQSVSMVGFH